MLETLVVRPKVIERARRSWLWGVIDGYLAQLSAQRHPINTLRTYAYRLLKFGEFVEQHGDCELAHLPRWIDSFVEQLHLSNVRARAWRSAATCFIRYLRQPQAIPTPASVLLSSSHAEVIEKYTTYLIEERGISRDGVRYTRRICTALMEFLGKDDASTLLALQPEAITRFLTAKGKRYGRSTLKLVCTVLRGYLSYLYRSNAVQVDLSRVVVAPRVYKQEQCPRFLTRAEVEKVLTAIDRQTPKGARDYAMILLLAVYGLRGIEVIRLRLGDIDWRNQQLHIRGRKAGNNSTYPLAGPVGDAIVAYLEKSRPKSSHRQVFLSVLTPYAPLTGSKPLGLIVRRYLARAQVQIIRPGTHTFRYSCAQRLFEDGASLKSIGDYLGHGHPDSTQWYTKMAIDQLREVAINDGEDVL